ncbi:MAG: carboxy terminal-processing peptidase, partial [Pseudomonadota bacterium]|nr:carboxy terminal-processing peptidase [Pseudomonadota bacterium]
DELSVKVLESLIDSLDPMRLYFTTEDLDVIYQQKLLFDNYLRSANLEPFFEIFKEYRKRLIERTNYAVHLLESNLDFNTDEYVELDRKKVKRAAGRDDLNEFWRKRVKNEYLSIKLSGKKNHDEVKATLIRRYQGLQRRTKQLNADDVYQIAINSYTSEVDPHTTYFTPRSTENFKISMSLSLEGIGAVLQNKDEHTVIRKIVPGGPADLSGKLFPDDRIVSIGQNRKGKLVDVVGWRLDDVVDLIRGPKGSTVILEILAKKENLGGATKLVTIIRDEIKLEEQAAKSFSISRKNQDAIYKLGVIEIPTFYLDFDGRKAGKKDYKSTTRDVSRLIKEMEKQKIDGIVIDVRGNGGGSLSEATSLTGLFINNGPVVQIKDYSGSIEIENDPLNGIIYSGPLVILVDRNSASASEIFAGAIQDYNRGFVVGESTYGKGTVQNLIDLNRWIKDDEEDRARLGQLKATMAQFFRVSGDSTQHRGVVPHIIFEGMIRPSDHGEKALDNALPWAEIAETPHRKLDDLTEFTKRLQESHKSRIDKNQKIQHFFKIEKEVIQARKKKKISLLESYRILEFEKNKRAQRESENKFRQLHGLPPLKPDLPDESDTDFEEELYEEPEYDAILMETVDILTDLVILTAEQQ